jgi:Lrp/AsnC family leucine-responsive transcriptional regulator
VIKGYHARVNPAALGKNLLVFVEITLAQKSEHIFKRCATSCKTCPRCWNVT